MLARQTSYVLAAFLLGIAFSPTAGALSVPSDPSQPGKDCVNWNARSDPKFFTSNPHFNILNAGMVTWIDSSMRLISGDYQLSSHMKGCNFEKEVMVSEGNDYNYYSGSQTGSSIALKFSPTNRGGPNLGHRQDDVEPKG